MAEPDPLKLSMDQRLDYLLVVASIAGVDNDVSEEEKARLRSACEKLALTPDAADQIISAAEEPDPELVAGALGRLKGSELKFAVLTDCIFLAYADGKTLGEEIAEVLGIAEALDIDVRQVNAIRRYVEGVREAGRARTGEQDLKSMGGDIAAGLSAVGVPVGVVALAGSKAGMSAGLVAMGLGLGAPGGAGVATVIAVGTYAGVRWAYKRVAGA